MILYDDYPKVVGMNAASTLGTLCSFLLLGLLFPPHHSLLDDVDVDVEDVQKDEDDAEGGGEAALVAGVLVQGSLAVEAGGGVQAAGGEVGAGTGLGHEEEGQGQAQDPEGIGPEEQTKRLLLLLHGVRLGRGRGRGGEGRGGLAGGDGCQEAHGCNWRT